MNKIIVWIILWTLLVLFLTAVIALFAARAFDEPMPKDANKVTKVAVDAKGGFKEITIPVSHYVGLPGPHGWVGWVTDVYVISVPLGRNGLISSPIPKIERGFLTSGYIKLDMENKQLVIKYKMGRVDTNALSKDGIIKFTGEEDAKINGTYPVENMDAFR